MGKIKIIKYISIFITLFIILNTIFIHLYFPDFKNRGDYFCYHTDALLPFLECKNDNLGFMLNLLSSYYVMFLIFLIPSIFVAWGELFKGELLFFTTFFSITYIYLLVLGAFIYGLSNLYDLIFKGKTK